MIWQERQSSGLLWRISLLLCTALVLAGSAGAGMVTTDTSRGCSWLNPQACDSTVTTPVLGLMFLHMRKSGGTHILHFLSEWMRARGCFDWEEDIHGYENIDHGSIIRGWGEILEFRTPDKRSCPRIDFFHDEYSCFAGDLFSDAPPMISNIKHHMKLLTVLRNPIERIGSQFFHMESCYGRRHIMQYVQRLCQTNYHAAACRNEERLGRSRQHSSCPCIYNATNAAIEDLKTNEAVWFEWFQKSKLGFREQHMDNYFIKRLAWVDNTGHAERVQNASLFYRCLTAADTCDPKDSFSILQNSGQFIGCLVKTNTWRREAAALDIAKRLLQNHMHFLIMEYFDHRESIGRALASILEDESVIEMIRNGGWSKDPKASRFGHLASVTSTATAARKPDPILLRKKKRFASMTDELEVGTYQKLMPESVVQYVQDHNKEDFELYRFARQLYRDRYF